jgi:acyl-CoA thioester hydrolase
MAPINFREVNRRTVTLEQCDELGHMNIQHYYATLSEGMFNVMALIGMPNEEIATRRTSMALYKEEAEFIGELHEGTEFYMATALAHVGTKSMIFQHRFHNADDDLLLFKAMFVAVYMDLETRSGAPIPEDVKAAVLKEIPKYIEE